MSETTTQQYCSRRVHEPGAWRDSPCPRLATGEDGMCGPHRAGARKRAGHEARWDAERQRELFVVRWRKAHPEQTYKTDWTCSLCGLALQTVEGYDRPIASRVTAHIEAHGDDWTAYEQAAQPRSSAATDGEG